MAEYQRLDELCHINMGQSPDSKSYNQEGKGMPFFQGNADFGVMHPETRVWCNSPTKIVEPGTLLISVRAPIGALNFAKERSCIGRGLAGITPQNGVNLKYIYYCLKSKNKELNAKGTGSTFKAIAKNALGETSVKIVPEDDQQRIIQVLDSVSFVIETRKQQLTELDNLIKARFVELFGNPLMNSMGWPDRELSTYIQFLTSGSRGWAQYFTDTGEYFITIKNVKNCRITLNDVQHIVPPDNAEAKRTRVQEDDLLISITADLGRTGVVSKEIADHGGYINQHLTCIRLDRSAVRPLYVAYYMESDAGKSQFLSKNQSAVKAGLNFNSINSLRLMVPPVELQDAFIAFVAQVDKSKVVDAICKINTLFDITLNGGNRYDIRANEC